MTRGQGVRARLLPTNTRRLVTAVVSNAARNHQPADFRRSDKAASRRSCSRSLNRRLRVASSSSLLTVPGDGPQASARIALIDCPNRAHCDQARPAVAPRVPALRGARRITSLIAHALCVEGGCLGLHSRMFRQWLASRSVAASSPSAAVMARTRSARAPSASNGSARVRVEPDRRRRTALRTHPSRTFIRERRARRSRATPRCRRTAVAGQYGVECLEITNVAQHQCQNIPVPSGATESPAYALLQPAHEILSGSSPPGSPP